MDRSKGKCLISVLEEASNKIAKKKKLYRQEIYTLIGYIRDKKYIKDNCDFFMCKKLSSYFRMARKKLAIVKKKGQNFEEKKFRVFIYSDFFLAIQILHLTIMRQKQL